MTKHSFLKHHVSTASKAAHNLYRRGAGGVYGGVEAAVAIVTVLTFARHWVSCDVQCFEGMKAYRDTDGHVRLFRPELNIRRLNKSLRRLHFPTVDESAMLALLRCRQRVLRGGLDPLNQLSTGYRATTVSCCHFGGFAHDYDGRNPLLTAAGRIVEDKRIAVDDAQHESPRTCVLALMDALCALHGVQCLRHHGQQAGDGRRRLDTGGGWLFVVHPPDRCQHPRERSEAVLLCHS